MAEVILKTNKMDLIEEYASCNLGRIPENIRFQILPKILIHTLENGEKQFDKNKLDLICDLSKGGYEIHTYEMFNKAKKFLNDKTSLNLIDLLKRLDFIGKENINGKQPGMVYVPTGVFLYQKQEKITLPGFWIGRYPVTSGEFKKFVDAVGLFRFNEDFRNHWKSEIDEKESWHPVRYITWFEAALYCNWLSKNMGLEPTYNEKKREYNPHANGYRLPIEHEWEKAASWDDYMKEKRKYPWGNQFDPTLCNNSINMQSNGTVNVQKYNNGRSFYGCNDMAGNVWEWTESWSDIEKKYRVVRGGSWLCVDERDFLCTVRYFGPPSSCFDDLGFRVVCSAQF